VPSDLTVTQLSDLQFSFQSTYLVQQDDCIVFEMPNPYIYDKTPSSYAAFEIPGPTDCQFTSGHSGVCEKLDSQSFKITFDAASTEKKIIG